MKNEKGHAPYEMPNHDAQVGIATAQAKVAGECHAKDILSLLLLPSLLLLVLPSLVPLSCQCCWCRHRIAVADGLAIKKGQKKEIK